MTTLYRKYRPGLFADVEAQEHIVTTLKNEVALGSLAHAYIFSGPRGVGKTTLARLLAKAILCSHRKTGESEPCNLCPNCLDINAGRHLDVIEIDAASHTGVENVRENIIETARFQPARGTHKIFIIDEVHMLSGSAFNALLKTLEEPPPNVIFILATTELHKLPATVVSRCQRFQFKSIPRDALVAKLKKICAAENVQVETAVLDRVAHLSEGGLRDAESLLGQILSLNQTKITLADVALFLPSADTDTLLTIIENTFTGATAEALTKLDELAEAGAEAGHILGDLIELLRAVLIYQASKNETALALLYGSEAIKRIKTLTALYPKQIIVSAIEQALDRRVQLKQSPFPYLVIELWIIAGVSNAAATPPTPLTALPDNKKIIPVVKIETIAAVRPPPPPTPPPTGQKPAGLEPEPKISLGATIKSALSSLTRENAPPVTPLENVRERWPEIIQKISNHNHALTFILSMAKVNSLEADGLHLSVPYSLHRDKLLETKNRRIIEDCLLEAFSEKIRFHCELEQTAPAAVDSDILSVALQFGGEIVA